MQSLNPQQRAAVEHLSGPLLVLAGAGSGKTRVITEKIAHLIRDHGIAARRIAAITFTNKAAREMQHRVGDLLDKSQTRGLTVSTFHTFGLNFLRREPEQTGLRPGFSIFDAADALNVLKQITQRDSNDVLLAVARDSISGWKNDLLDPGQALAQAEDELDIRHAELYARYQQALRAYNAVDFDDLVLLPAQLLQRDPTLRQQWRERFRHLLVDEYQDTNAGQYALVRALVDVEGGLTAVGDDDQSIYAWRGARPENLMQLKQDFPRLQLIKLEQNYRSTNVILKAANQLIDNNPHEVSKRLWSALGEGEAIRILSCKDPDHEAARVVSEIMKHRFKARSNYRDYAILYRGNQQSRVFEKLLRENRIPYHISGGQSFFERSEIKDILAYLRLLANPDDDAAYLRIINVPRREIGASTLEKLGGYAGERRLSLFAASMEMGLQQVLSQKAALRLEQFADLVSEWQRQMDEQPPAELVASMIREVAYEDWLQDQSSNPKVAAKRIANVQDLVDWIGRLSREQDDQQGRSLADIVAHMCLLDMLDRASGENEADGVHLMTLHAAKGLEFPHVFLVGFEEELLPHRTSLEQDALEEERRLAYVGITRAQQTLCISHNHQRARFGEVQACEPSRFLEELPSECLVWPDKAPPDPQEARLTARAHLSNLKSLLG
ncbi:ATP-dependent DNA helicase Rep [Ectothiorhodosinus mongolicus]|uniref:ATP-dependent DNA helicase Rep n=1 Tax=Ectothiorhodosinus mongolicus TaxID=233100 RepID=A0A1R3VZU4_9GAMM|nr:UvrD-helicase domain-containing protein [Ectothiorhodosinus mongolicus]ULX57250.1 ATP-dependent DNA helicase Rep [Ectothiorhodosinus mongolicus]SIT70621.1 ATP-dependent DNA helicase Rep [Ectothiorhodosinus mongolicus]